MYYQTDPVLQFNAKSDCYIFDILRIHEIVGKHEFTYRQLKAMRKVMVRVDFIGQDGYINNKGISGISSVASGLTGHNVYIKRVGSNDNYNFLIAKFMRVTPCKRHHHFVLMEDAHNVMFDPWSKAGARTTKEGSIVSYRYIWAEAV